MDKELLQIFEGINSEGNCCQKANELVRSMSSLGYTPRIRRIFHKSNVFGNNPFLNCEHVCGESYPQHFVVEVEGHIFDPKLGIPVSSLEYLEKAYSNYESLRIS